MMIAGEASGDLLAAELVRALRDELAGLEARPTPDYQPLHASLEARFFGAGGPCMAAAGVELEFDLTKHSVIGLSDVFAKYFTFRRLFHRLRRMAIEREPDAIICVDFSGFNRRFAHSIRRYVRSRHDWFHDWRPVLIQYVSPQVWASREGRAQQMAEDYNLLLSTFAFEKDWYAAHAPRLRVESVGNPILDRYAGRKLEHSGSAAAGQTRGESARKKIVLLPGSRRAELRRHIPVMLEAARLISNEQPADFTMVLPDESLAAYANSLLESRANVQLQTGNLDAALSEADLAITKSGTITLECAYFRVPSIVLYKTSSLTYAIGRQIVKVRYLAMPNLLAGEEVFPEFIQGAATPSNIARAALDLLRDTARRQAIKAQLDQVVAGLGIPGASRRAARLIVELLEPQAGANEKMQNPAQPQAS